MFNFAKVHNFLKGSASKSPGQDKRGFTLIELLVVVSIIGVLSGATLVSMQGARAKARDSRRLMEMKQLMVAIRMYYDKYGSLPVISGDLCCDGWDQSPCLASPGNAFIGALTTAGITGSTPEDPGGKPSGLADNACYGYNYYVYPAGTSGCDAAKGPFFVLGIRNMETSGNPHPQSRGWSCPSRNWQGEFEWVTGGFTSDF